MTWVFPGPWWKWILSNFFPEEELLTAVREVSEDYIYDTLEFNEFLQMMAKQQNNVHTREDVKAAFRIFDDDDDGCIHAQDLVEVERKGTWERLLLYKMKK